jgi:hypothetical protein
MMVFSASGLIGLITDQELLSSLAELFSEIKRSLIWIFRVINASSHDHEVGACIDGSRGISSLRAYARGQYFHVPGPFTYQRKLFRPGGRRDYA